MTPFQSLPSSRSGGISIQEKGSALIQCARGSLGNNNPGYPVYLRGNSRCFVYFSREEHLFPQHKAVGCWLFLRASSRPSRSPYCLEATLQVHLCDALFLSRRLDLQEARFRYVSARPPVGQCFDLPWMCVGFALFWSGREFFWQSWRLVFTSSPWSYFPTT
jgi:hypothetical protein